MWIVAHVYRGARLTRFREPPSGEAKHRSSCSDTVVSEPSPLEFRTDSFYVAQCIDPSTLLIVFIRSDIPSHRDCRFGCALVALRNVIHTYLGEVKRNMFC